jgi:hypothetical protein
MQHRRTTMQVLMLLVLLLMLRRERARGAHHWKRVHVGVLSRPGVRACSQRPSSNSSATMGGQHATLRSLRERCAHLHEYLGRGVAPHGRHRTRRTVTREWRRCMLLWMLRMVLQLDVVRERRRRVN